MTMDEFKQNLSKNIDFLIRVQEKVKQNDYKELIALVREGSNQISYQVLEMLREELAEVLVEEWNELLKGTIFVFAMEAEETPETAYTLFADDERAGWFGIYNFEVRIHNPKLAIETGVSMAQILKKKGKDEQAEQILKKRIPMFEKRKAELPKLLEVLALYPSISIEMD